LNSVWRNWMFRDLGKVRYLWAFLILLEVLFRWCHTFSLNPPLRRFFSRRMAQWTVLRGRPLDDQSDDEEEGEEEEEEELNLDTVDLYTVLKIPRGSNTSRVRSAYHRLSARWHPNEFRSREPPVVQHAWRTFRSITVAYLALKDDARREIYDKHGHAGLAKSEEYAERNVFHEDPIAVYDAFYEGVDPADKEYLLLHASTHPSDSEGEDEALPPEVLEAVAAAKKAPPEAAAPRSESEGEEDDDEELPEEIQQTARMWHGRGRGCRPAPDDAVLVRASTAVGATRIFPPAGGPTPADPFSTLAAKFSPTTSTPHPVAEAAVVPTSSPVVEAEASVAPVETSSRDPNSIRRKPLQVGALRKRRTPTEATAAAKRPRAD